MTKFDPDTEISKLEQFGEFGGVNPSITDSATFTFLDADTMVDTFHGESEGCFLYSRHWNPGNKYLAVSLGYFKTLFSCSGSITSSEVPEDIQKEMGMSPGLVRFSVGIDNDIERTYKLIKESF